MSEDSDMSKSRTESDDGHDYKKISGRPKQLWELDPEEVLGDEEDEERDSDE